MYLCPSCGILETTSLCWLGALPLVSLPSPKVSVSSESCSLLMGKSRPRSLSHSVAFGPEALSPGSPPTSAGREGTFPSFLPFPGATESLSEIHAAATARRRTTDVKPDGLSQDSGWNVGVTFAPDYVGAENEKYTDSEGCFRKWRRPSQRLSQPLCSFLRPLLFRGFSPNHSRRWSPPAPARSGPRPPLPKARPQGALRPSTQSCRSGRRPEWPTVGRACSLTGARGAGGLGCAMKWPLQKEQETLLLRESG